jgi:hypothetical protein
LQRGGELLRRLRPQLLLEHGMAVDYALKLDGPLL